MLKRFWLLIPVLVVFALLATTTVNAEIPTRKIVVFKAGFDTAMKDAAVREVGGRQLKSLKQVNAVAAELTPASVSALVARGNVLRVADDGIAREHAIEPPAGETGIRNNLIDRGFNRDRGEQLPWGIRRIRAPESWKVSTGKGIKVAVLDSGIDLSHPDIHVAGGVCEVDGVESYDDDRGHGTHVAGIIAALDNSYGVAGVGPDIQLYAVKVLDKTGAGWWSDIFAGLDWCVDHGMQVANMSFGSSQYDETYAEVIYQTYKAGVLLVASAGNNGPTPDSVHYPAKYPGVLAVSAIDSNDKIASWSSIGPDVDLAAPGVDIYSTYTKPKYATMSGTSAAAPHVAGVAALRMKVDRDRSPDHIADVLKRNASKLPGLTPDQQGAGLVDAYRVVNAR